MTLDDAVEVLNERKYLANKGDGVWRASVSGDEPAAIIEDGYGWPVIVFPDDAAIAVAEKLERQVGRDMPATRKLIDGARTHLEHVVDQKIPDGTRVYGFGGVTYGDLRAAVAEWEANP